MWRPTLAVSFLVLFGVSTAHAIDFSSTNFVVKDPVQASGGGYGTSTNFQLWGSLSQPAIGKSTSNSNELRAGFLYFSSAVTPPPPPPPPPPSDPGGGGPVGPPPPPPPASGLSFIIEPIISFITGEPIPFPGCKRSDFNCDGSVDLTDLSILLTKPKVVTSKVLSFLFSDWTKQLPGFFGVGNFALEAPSVKPSAKPLVQGLAQVSIAVGGATTTPHVAPSTSIGKFFRTVIVGFVRFIQSVFATILKLFRT